MVVKIELKCAFPRMFFPKGETQIHLADFDGAGECLLHNPNDAKSLLHHKIPRVEETHNVTFYVRGGRIKRDWTSSLLCCVSDPNKVFLNPKNSLKIKKTNTWEKNNLMFVF